MTAAAVAMGLRGKYPMQAARALAFRRWMLAWAMGAKPRGARRFAFWCAVCMDLDKEPRDVA